MPQFTPGHLKEIQNMYEKASIEVYNEWKVIGVIKANAAVMRVEAYIAKEWRAMGWNAFEANLRCKTCGYHHFGNGEWPLRNNEKKRDTFLRALREDYLGLRDEFRKTAPADVKGEVVEELLARLKQFWKRYLEATEKTECDEQYSGAVFKDQFERS
jgi:hypothetical protein